MSNLIILKCKECGIENFWDGESNLTSTLVIGNARQTTKGSLCEHEIDVTDILKIILSVTGISKEEVEKAWFIKLREIGVKIHSHDWKFNFPEINDEIDDFIKLGIERKCQCGEIDIALIGRIPENQWLPKHLLIEYLSDQDEQLLKLLRKMGKDI